MVINDCVTRLGSAQCYLQCSCCSFSSLVFSPPANKPSYKLHEAVRIPGSPMRRPGSVGAPHPGDAPPGFPAAAKGLRSGPRSPPRRAHRPRPGRRHLPAGRGQARRDGDTRPGKPERHRPAGTVPPRRTRGGGGRAGGRGGLSTPRGRAGTGAGGSPEGVRGKGAAGREQSGLKPAGKARETRGSPG